ncbi:MAG: beta-lactamase family protein [Actinomycetia bacterium]|nr:beta-lactamase family protein [Actinomycetes bacterium]
MSRRFLFVLATVGLFTTACISSTTSEGVPEAELTKGPLITAIPDTEAPDTTVPDTTVPDVSPDGFDFSAIGPVVQDYVDAENLNGAGLIVVHREHGVIYHDHWGDFDEDRISLIASSSKMITATVLMRLHDDGVLDVDQPVSELTGWDGDNQTITVAQLLSNSSGLVGLTPDPTYAPYLCQFIPIGDLASCAESIFETAADDDDIVPPDTEFRYGGAQWQVAGGVAEVASGRSWSDLVGSILVEPCGLETLDYNNHFAQMSSGFAYPEDFDSDPSLLSPSDNPNMEGGVYTNTSDYGKLLLMHLRGGMCGDEQVVTQSSLDRMHQDRIGEVYDGDTWSPSVGYGMGWWVDRTTGRISDGGAYGSVPWLDLEDGYGAFLVIEDTSPTGQALAELLYDHVDSAVASPG